MVRVTIAALALVTSSLSALASSSVYPLKPDDPAAKSCLTERAATSVVQIR